jgi:serine/threonine-protein kinase
LPVTTASDVYQLGLLLYELLCGHRAQRVGHTGPASIERVVCEQDPTRPSQRIGSGDTELALRRHLQPRQLRRRLRGDLDTIVGKALQKLPDRRYGTVDELIDDLIRSRQGRTLHARPDTWRYRMGRFVRRHPVGLAFAVLTLALLSIYLVTLNLQAQALERERDRAQAEAAKARQVQSLVQRLFEGIDPDVSGGEPLSVQALLDRSFAQIEGELGAHPDVRAELLLTVGDVYAALGNYARASELLTQAFELVEALEDEQPLLAAKVYRSRGRLLVMGNTPTEAAPMLERSLRLLRRAGNAYEDQIAATRFVQADLLRRIDRMSDAALASREALQLRRRSLSEHHPDLASSLNQLAVIDRRLNRNEEAELLLREAIHLLEVTLPSDHPRISETRADLAAVLRSLERIDESEALFKQAIAGLEESRGSDHPYLGIVLGNYGNLLLDQGRPLDALPIYQRALRICNQQYGTVHARTALAHSNLGRALNALGRTGEAISSFRWAISALPESHDAWQGQFRQNLGSLLLEEGAAAEALSEFERAYSLIRADSRGAREAAVLLRWQAQARLRLGEVAIAADTAAEAVGLLKRSGEDPFALAEARALLGESLIALNRKSEAIEQLEQALALHRENGRATPDRLQAIENQLAQARRRSAQTPP